jgi:GTP-binding protein
MIMGELASYSEDLVRTPMIAVITKMDLPENGEPAAKLKKAFTKQGIPVHEISAVTGAGVQELLKHTAQLLKKTRKTGALL